MITTRQEVMFIAAMIVFGYMLVRIISALNSISENLTRIELGIKNHKSLDRIIVELPKNKR